MDYPPPSHWEGPDRHEGLRDASGRVPNHLRHKGGNKGQSKGSGSGGKDNARSSGRRITPRGNDEQPDDEQHGDDTHRDEGDQQ